VLQGINVRVGIKLADAAGNAVSDMMAGEQDSRSLLDFQAVTNAPNATTLNPTSPNTYYDTHTKQVRAAQGAWLQWLAL
jgi:hypothetical protein